MVGPNVELLALFGLKDHRKKQKLTCNFLRFVHLKSHQASHRSNQFRDSIDAFLKGNFFIVR